MKPNNTSNVTTDALSSPITPAEFADFMSLDYNPSDDALLNGFLLTSCEMCISYTNIELLTRNYTMKLDRFPDSESSMGGIAPIASKRLDWIELPLAPVTSVTSVTVNDVAYTDFTADTGSRPARVIFDSFVSGPIVINYTAGRALATSIDSTLLMGIKLLASYMFDNRGCDVVDAANKSGAVTLWSRSRVLIGGL